jgi:hypothetical protein
MKAGTYIFAKYLANDEPDIYHIQFVAQEKTSVIYSSSS